MSRLPDAAAVVVDHAAVAEAQSVRAAVRARYNLAVAAQERAKGARLAAADRSAELLRQVVNGEEVSEAAIIQAHADSRAAVDLSTFWGAAVGALKSQMAQAEAVFAEADAQAHRPIVEWAARVRIAAATALDHAKAVAARAESTHTNTPPKLRDEAPLLAARAALIAATEAMKSVCAMSFDALHHAELSKGVKLPRPLVSLPHWQTSTEAVERSYWGVPVPEPETEPASAVAAD